jgi:adenylosuccinate synthase
MPTTCVIGAQRGDEGKARVVDLLADDADVIVRFQGGSNAGHTVMFGGETYRLHLVPSGIFRQGKTCVVAHGVVVDLEILFGEIDDLVRRGHAVTGSNLMISDRAQLVMPWHKILDQAREKAAGAGKMGTTGRGIGPCYADKVSYRGIRVCDLYEPEWFEERLRQNLAEKNPVLERVYGERPLDLATIRDQYLAFAERVRPLVGDAVGFLHDAVASGKKVLFEGAQAALLDVDVGVYPYVTASNSSALGVSAGTGLPPHAIHRVIGCAKAYATHVGSGPFPTEDHGDEGQRMRDVGREYGTTTGRPRRCGWFDAVAVKFAVRCNGIDALAFVKLDVLRGFPTLRICTAYDLPSGRTTQLPASAAAVARAKPVYRELPGFAEDISHVRRFEDLPANAQAFIRAIETECGVPVCLVSVGPSREQVIRLDGRA